MGIATTTGVVGSVHRSDGHTFSKTTVDQVELVAGLGVAGDAHHGAQVRHRSRVKADPTQPNLRQVHLIHAELFDLAASAGFDVGPGDLGENITTSGIDLLSLPVGTTLAIGDEALITLTGLRNPCPQIDAFQNGLLPVVRPRADDGSVQLLAGVMGVVITGGPVVGGDLIETSPPPGTPRPLRRV